MLRFQKLASLHRAAAKAASASHARSAGVAARRRRPGVVGRRSERRCLTAPTWQCVGDENRHVALGAVSTAVAIPEAGALVQQDPWHVFSPRGLAAVNTAGNLCALAYAAAHDHTLVRLLAGAKATSVLAYYLLMPKPLKMYQRVAASWGFAFACLHFANLAWLLHEQSHRISLSEEEEDIYEHTFQNCGVTPRQFQKLLKAGAEFKTFSPGEVIASAEKPVDRIFFVVEGSCQGVRGTHRTLVMEHPEGVFLGELRPKIWRAEFLGCGKSLNIVEEERHLEADLEEAWLLDHTSPKLPPRTGSRSRSMRKMLSAGLQERMGSTTKLCSGSAWTTTMAAGPAGCKLLSWPLGAFSCAVGAEEKFCDAMERVDEMSLASKVCAGATEKYIEGYRELLECVVADGRIDPAEKHALHRYRVRHSVPCHVHVSMLQEFGWTEAEYHEGILKSKWSSMLGTWRKKHPKKVAQLSTERAEAAP